MAEGVNQGVAGLAPMEAAGCMQASPFLRLLITDARTSI